MDSLQNHLLIAMPSLQETFFERAVIYVCEHDARGAMGLIINRPLGIEIDELLRQMELPEQPKVATELHAQVLIGGPVTPDRGFVLHDAQPHWSNSQTLANELMLTSSRDILSALGTDKAPKQFMVALGYAGWSKDQLEQEVADNVWLTIPATKALLFEVPYDERWQQACRALGFDTWQISHQTGHA
ncbi:YqgE/AlgH family protein [Shewanella salipaludis]|uniref:UPF0301 protein HC757_05835 n=1 Tax=Shewanella salipaludis TaxID=2723052 RepID=A0A972JI63_9GAMM|nr:YqgE/AlgH family protein [Shewanella salipaludis]NMH64688.1 YqgE/AlgH family protein [Shewanella salipaludis]